MQPLERIENLVIAFLTIALCVGVLDTEHEGAVRMACLRPVEQGGTDHAHMRCAGRRRAEAHAHVLWQLRLSILAFFVVSFGHTLYCAAREGRTTNEHVNGLFMKKSRIRHEVTSNSGFLLYTCAMA